MEIVDRKDAPDNIQDILLRSLTCLLQDMPSLALALHPTEMCRYIPRIMAWGCSG